jgi:hypothetical protein
MAVLRLVPDFVPALASPFLFFNLSSDLPSTAQIIAFAHLFCRIRLPTWHGDLIRARRAMAVASGPALILPEMDPLLRRVIDTHCSHAVAR